MRALRAVCVRPAPRAWRALCAVAFVLGVAGILSHADAGAREGLLMVMPALALGLLMLARPYAGERLIARLRAGSSQHAPAGRSPSQGRPRDLLLVCGGRLLVGALAGRAPPVSLAARP